MLGLSANLNYYLFNGNVDMRNGIFRLCESIRTELSLDPSDVSNVYMFMSKNRKVVKISWLRVRLILTAHLRTMTKMQKIRKVIAMDRLALLLVSIRYLLKQERRLVLLKNR